MSNIINILPGLARHPFALLCQQPFFSSVPPIAESVQNSKVGAHYMKYFPLIF